MMRIVTGLMLTMILTVAQSASAAIIVHNSDFIDNGSRTGFNGFENIPNDGNFYNGGSGPYAEDSISVAQVNGDPGNSIWTNPSFWTGSEGNSWYPNAGDFGYTTISLEGGADFQSVGFNFGSGGRPLAIMYELVNDGVVVLSGMANFTDGVNYLGFSGGGFDLIRIRDTVFSASGSVTDGSFQALAIDNIETTNDTVVTPEPSSIALLAIGGLVAAGGAFRRRRQAAKA